MLINCLRGMKRKARGAQESRHIWKYVEVTSTAQRGDSPVQAINQRFRNKIRPEGRNPIAQGNALWVLYKRCAIR